MKHTQKIIYFITILINVIPATNCQIYFFNHTNARIRCNIYKGKDVIKNGAAVIDAKSTLTSNAEFINNSVYTIKCDHPTYFGQADLVLNKNDKIEVLPGPADTLIIHKDAAPTEFKPKESATHVYEMSLEEFEKGKTSFPASVPPPVPPRGPQGTPPPVPPRRESLPQPRPGIDVPVPAPTPASGRPLPPTPAKQPVPAPGEHTPTPEQLQLGFKQLKSKEQYENLKKELFEKLKKEALEKYKTYNEKALQNEQAQLAGKIFKMQMGHKMKEAHEGQMRTSLKEERELILLEANLEALRELLGNPLTGSQSWP